jgi:hypothetical protein
MYLFTLVDDVEKVVEAVRTQHGEFAVALLYNDVPQASSGWNLIVAAPWTDEMGRADATHILAYALNQGLGPENQRAISRITVMAMADPFVRDVLRFYPVTPGAPKPITHLTAGGISEGGGYILYSQPPEPMRAPL